MYDKYANIDVELKQKHFDKLNVYKEDLKKNPKLKTLFIEMTLACNEHCLHCGSNCGDIILKNSLTDEEIISTLKQLKNDLYKEGEPLPFLAITGGEPLLRKNLIQLMKEIHSMGYKWGMTSNGTLITREVAQQLKDAGMYSIGLSLDGLEESHDWFRQTNGGYKLALEATDNLIEAKIPSVMITTVVNKRNIGELDAIYEVVREHNCKSWRIINVEPIGRALLNKDLMLDKKEYQYILNYIAEHQDLEDMEILYSCNHYVGLELERKVRSWYYFCGAGIKVASIQYNGDISACLDIERRPDLIYGNVRTDNLLDIWKTKFEIFRIDKTEKSEKCKNCEHRNNCQGGGYHTWNFDKNEPRICMLEQLDIKD